MVDRPGALIGLTVIAIATADSSWGETWQPGIVYPGFQHSEVPGYQLSTADFSQGRYLGFLGSAMRHPGYTFRPLKQQARVPALIQGYRFREHRPSAIEQPGFRPLELEGATGDPGYENDRITSEKRHYPATPSSQVYPRWSGSAPVLRPERDSARRTTRSAFREISGAAYRRRSPDIWFDAADSKLPERGLVSIGGEENYLSHRGRWNWSSTVPSLTDSYRIWEFPKR